MSGGDFIDSNVLVYLFQEQEPRKQEIAAGLIRTGRAQSVTISFQVVSETLNVLTQKVSPPFNAEEAGDAFHGVLLPIWRIMPSGALYSNALSLKARYQYSFSDSLIIAAALEAGCDRLLSEDLQHGQRIEGLTIVNPFLDA